ncbi:MAG: bL17 family ribosomal protein [Aeoliella sp.]
MRHRRRGRKLGRNPNHQRALLRSLASELILTERDPDHVLFDKELSKNAPAPPRVPGRIVTTVAKAKEVRPLVERCVTIAKKALVPLETAERMEPDGGRGGDAWKSWRKGDQYREWNSTMAPALAARRRLIQLLGSKEAAEILIDDIAPRFVDRAGGYTRVVKLAQPRLGDAGPQALLEFVGKRDRKAQKSERPTFDDTDDDSYEEVAEESTEELSDETAEESVAEEKS